MSKTRITLELLLGLLDEYQIELIESENKNDMVEYKIKRAQQKLIGETLSGAKSKQLSKELRASLWSSMEIKQSIDKTDEDKVISYKSAKSYGRKLLFHWVLSGSLAASLLLTATGFFPMGSAIDMQFPETSYAVLTSKGNDASWYVNVANSYITLIPINTYQNLPLNDLELWVISEQKKVISLGIIEDHNVIKLAINQLNLGAQDSIKTFAISLEKPGGSNSGKPEGKVIYVSDIKTFENDNRTEI